MKGRRAARRLAVDVLYEAAIRDGSPVEAFRTRQVEGWVVPTTGDDELEHVEGDGEPTLETETFALHLVEGVEAHRTEIDDLIASTAEDWDIERMPVIDATVLRVAVFELLWGDEVPVAVVINEAIEMVKTLSTEGSGGFVNGLLGAISERRGARGSSR